MTRNQLPEGVGKKIVEALKRQAEADITPVEDVAVSAGSNLPLTDIEDLPEIQYENLNIANDDLIIEEEPIMTEALFQPREEVVSSFVEQPAVQMQAQTIPQPQVESIVQPQPVTQKTEVEYVSKPFVQPQPISQQVNQALFSNISMNEETLKKAIIQSTSQISIPANVATLRNLINSLPVGVTKQTGAQIIRQTLEAMGIPMNNVLKEAQMFQEELNSSTRECMIKIQEYKTQIMQLEASVQEYQQNINQVNDIVSLFLLTDK